MIKDVKIIDLILVLITIVIVYGIALDLRSRWNRIEKIDWHDWRSIEADKKRVGLGEQGKAAHLPSYPDHSKDIIDTYGYNGYLSDQIALDRSLADLRPPE